MFQYTLCSIVFVSNKVFRFSLSLFCFSHTIVMLFSGQLNSRAAGNLQIHVQWKDCIVETQLLHQLGMAARTGFKLQGRWKSLSLVHTHTSIRWYFLMLLSLLLAKDPSLRNTFKIMFICGTLVLKKLGFVFRFLLEVFPPSARKTTPNF